MDPDPTMSVSDTDDLRERLWAYEDFSAAQEHPSVDVTGAFASLGFLRAALGRTKRLWLGLGALGLLVGCGLYVGFPPAYSASTTLLLTNSPGQDPTTVMLTNQSLAESIPVATAVVNTLGLAESPGALLATYTVTPVTDQVLQISVSATSSAGAVQLAQTIGNQFLIFRSKLLNTQEQSQETALNQQVAASQQSLNTLGTQITRLGGTIPTLAQTTTPSPAPPITEVGKLEAQYVTADNKLLNLKQQVSATNVQNEVNVTSEIDGSQVLNPATAAKHSKLKYIAYDIVSAVFAGLVLGMAIVVVRALISDRLRRRDDIALALGAPVKLSVGPVRKDVLPFGAAGRAVSDRNLRRIATYLRQSAQGSSKGGPSTVAVVPVDNAEMTVRAVALMAKKAATDGLRVLVADLTPGAQAARALGAKGIGMVPVRANNCEMVVMIPDPDDLVPLGYRRVADSTVLESGPDKALLNACRSADLVVTVIELDPATGGEHLATWATSAVAVVTAGRTHGQKAYAVGEMLRLSGVDVVSAVLVDADKEDDSLGTDPALQEFLAAP
jgi:capsular polysaccharide biosynthesis protein